MVMVKRVFIVLLSLVILLMSTGCSNDAIRDKKLNIERYNQQVEFLMTQYETSKTSAEKFENMLIEGVFSGKIDAQSISSTYASEIKSVMEEVQRDIQDILQYNTDIQISNFSMNPENEGLVIDEEQIELEVFEELKGSIECYYFLDSNNGVVEQTFLLPNKNGNHGLLSLYWLEGKIFKISYKITGGVI